MSNESFEQVERQIASVRAMGLPTELRGVVLDEVHRELRASRWDRRLARVAAVLLLLGVAMNIATELRLDGLGDDRLAGARGVEQKTSLVDSAIMVAEITDAMTARQFARQMAAMAGRKLTADEAAAIDTAVKRQSSRSSTGNRG